MFVLPKLSYAYDALEPYIDAQTMEIHYTKHHQAYIDALNKALVDYPHLQQTPIEKLLMNLETLPVEINMAVRNQGGGHYNHTLFWQWLTPPTQAARAFDGSLMQEIVQQFGSFVQFQNKFEEAARLRFGSGWAWLVLTPPGNLEIISTANQDNPLSIGKKPILGLDVWEHAYYLKYQNRRVDYSKAWWHVVNWEYAQELFTGL